MAEFVNNVKVFSLSDITRSIERTLSDRYKSSFWVRAEMIKLNLYTASGHAYPDLVEKKDGRIISQLRALMWKSDFERSSKMFEQVTKEPLKDGITILFQARIIFSSIHGLSLQIIDINPSYTLGELEKERQQTLERLKTEGIFDLNKSLSLSAIPKRLALISVQTSKGFSDFNQVIKTNKGGYKIFSRLFPSLLQGDNAVETMIEALNTIAVVKEYFDAVLIIRGGGGDIGLSCYNNYDLCRAIATYPLPVLTGIGHSTNETVAEMVAYRNAITPTELADFILQHFQICDADINDLSSRLLASTIDITETERQKIEILRQNMITKAQKRITKEREDLDIRAKYLHLLNPLNIISKGYSLTTINGKIIKSIHDVQTGDEIQTMLSDGSLHSQVQTAINSSPLHSLQKN
ncbi:MAG: exodeoxyribonuclease VII large subunit [Bacteroidales bacterium]|jgi:exodeoxyribonuclease VII large subunit|nr:exodeoxyribonuclease VII large subunit [Bacteroidales bacterium]